MRRFPLCLAQFLHGLLFCGKVFYQLVNYCFFPTVLDVTAAVTYPISFASFTVVLIFLMGFMYSCPLWLKPLIPYGPPLITGIMQISSDPWFLGLSPLPKNLTNRFRHVIANCFHDSVSHLSTLNCARESHFSLECLQYSLLF